MGLVTTVKSKSNEVFTVSTISREKKLHLKGNSEPVFVVCESAIYNGKPKPLRTTVGKKPFLTAFNVYLYAGTKFDIGSFHELVSRILKDNAIKTPDDFVRATEFLTEHQKSRQLMLGLKKIDFVYIYPDI